MKNKNTSLVILAGSLILFAWYFWSHQSDFAILLGIKPIYLAMVALGHLAAIFTNGLFIKLILQSYNKYIDVRESFYIALISAVGNFFLPVGSGTGVRAVYLKRKFKLNYKNFLSTLSGNYIIAFLFIALAGIVSLLALRINTSPAVFWPLLTVFGAILLVTSWLAVFGLPVSLIKSLSNIKNQKIKRLARLTGEVLAGWNMIAGDKRLVLKLFAITGLNFFTLLVITYASIRALELNVSVWSLVLYSALGSVSLLVNITPGSIGIKEAVYVYAASALGLTAVEILSVALIDRGVRFLILLLGWVGSRFTKRPNDIRANLKA